MSMHSHTTGTNISSDSEVRQPQIFYVNFPERSFYGGVELLPGEHRGRWIGEVE